MNKATAKVVDPALWVPECYDVVKKDSSIIGIGVVRPKIFADNKKSVYNNQIFSFYLDLIHALENRGHDWQIFCNGGDGDWEFAEKLYSALGKPFGKLAEYPKTTKDLVNIISGYKAVVAGRLHAVISATALDIPALGIVWADKFDYFQQDFKLEKFIHPKDFVHPEQIVERLECSIEKGVDENNKNLLKSQTYKILQKELCECLKG